MADVKLVHIDGVGMLDRLADVTALYLDIRAEQDHTGASIYDPDVFVKRTTRQAGQLGFSAVLAISPDDKVIGFAFGFTFGAGEWWSGNPTPPTPEILERTKFALIELDVATAMRGQGIGRRLMDELLADRPEPYAVLTSVPGTPARGMYDRWGWVQMGTAQHAPDAPVMDQLVLPLRP